MNQPTPVTEPPVPGTPLTGDAPTDAESAEANGSRGRQEPRKPPRSFLAELPVLVIIAFALALLLKTFLVQAFYIPSSSMEPTLEVGDRVLVNKLAYAFREPERGEVVVFTDHDEGGAQEEPGSTNPLRWLADSLGSGLGLAHPGDRDFIKRIIGLPGETVEMRDGVVHVDGDPVPELTSDEGGYLSTPDMFDFGPVDVPADAYFMMGDNRPNSADSRSTLGTIEREDIVGRAFVIIWPVTRMDTLPIADYPAATTTPAPAEGPSDIAA